MALRSKADFIATRAPRLKTGSTMADELDAKVLEEETNSTGKSTFKIPIECTLAMLEQLEATVRAQGWVPKRVDVTDHSTDGTYLRGAIEIE